ncbi:MAG: hypothetical protein ACXVP4_00670 [Bacteroidia bacterium]
MASLFILALLLVFLALTIYKKELTGIIKKHIETQYGLNVQIDDADVSLFKNWPNAAINFKNVTLTSLIDKKDNEPMFAAESIFLSFDLTELLKKKFIVNAVFIEHAKVNLLKDSLGNTNFKLLSKEDKAKNNSVINFDINKLSLLDVKFDFHNKEKHIGFLLREGEVKISTLAGKINAKITGIAHTDELLFKPNKGPFLSDKEVELNLNADFYPKYKSIFVDTTSYAIIENQKYSLVSFVDLTEKKQLTLKITAKQVDVKKGLSLLSMSIQNNMRSLIVKEPIDVSAVIITKLGKAQEPYFAISIIGKDNDMKIGDIGVPLNNVSFKGFIFSHSNPDEAADLNYATISFNDVKGKIYNCPFTGTVEIKNFNDPHIVIGADLLVDASKVDLKPGKDFILNGFCFAKVNYSAPTSCLNIKDFLSEETNLSCGVYFNKFSYKTDKNGPAYKIVGSANVLKDNLLFKKLELKTVGGSFFIDGKALGFVEYACGLSKGFSASVNARSTLFDLTPLIAKSFQKDSIKKTTSPKAKKNLKTIQKSDFTFDISMFVKKFKIRQVSATDVFVKMSYAYHSISVKKMFMNACGGTLEATGSLVNFSDLDAKVTITNMDAKAMFEQFENFGQNKIDSKNIVGTISLDANLSSGFDEKFEIIPENMEGQVVLKINEGHLLNFEPLQNLSNYIFRKRNFEDITFSDIEGKFLLYGTKMQVKDLELASNILNMYVNGVCNFKGESTINMRIPWNNLKKRGENYIPENKGTDGEAAKSLLLNYKGLPGKMKIGLGNKKLDSL